MAGWRPRLNGASQAVLAMTHEVGAPTAPLREFAEAYRQDDNLWWALQCGHHQNLLDAALEELATLEPSWYKVVYGDWEGASPDDGNRSGPT